MNFTDAVKSGLKNYARVSGRASRSEYWYFCLFYTAAIGMGALVDHFVFPDYFFSKNFGVGYTAALAQFGLLVPAFCVYMRRLHDVGRSGWWWLITLTVIGLIPLLYWTVKRGENKPNRYGEDVTAQEAPPYDRNSTVLACAALLLAICPFVFYTPATLPIAAQDGKRDVVLRLIEKGADVDAPGFMNMTPLVAAVLMGHTDVAGILIDKGADVNKKGIYGLTPLMAATANNNVEIVALLLKHGAAVQDPDTGGHPSLDMAVKQGYTKIAEMLQKAADK